MSINEIFNMYFGIIEDERCEVNVKHPLVNILKLVLIAVLCGMDELPAVKELIEMLDVEGKIITADAMHCQKETAKKIIDNKGDYVLQLKANQKNFYEDVYAMFDEKYMDETDTNCEYEVFCTVEKSHGRIEKRTCYVLNEIEFFTDYLAEWKGLKKIFAVKREVERSGEKTSEISCYLSSKNTTAENLLSYTRKHWQIESMHHILDVSYDEDKCRLYSQLAIIATILLWNFTRKFMLPFKTSASVGLFVGTDGIIMMVDLILGLSGKIDESMKTIILIVFIITFLIFIILSGLWCKFEKYK